MKEFERAVNFTLKMEGGLSEDKDDPGGTTKYGISKRAYPNLNIKDLSLEGAKAIYYKDYWLKSHCDEFQFPMNIVIFDAAVHHGVSRAKELLKNTKTWEEYLLKRIGFMTTCKNATKYMKGWSRRVVALYEYIKKEIEKND
jgi:lysozyme family protein